MRVSDETVSEPVEPPSPEPTSSRPVPAPLRRYPQFPARASLEDSLEEQRREGAEVDHDGA